MPEAAGPEVGRRLTRPWVRRQIFPLRTTNPRFIEMAILHFTVWRSWLTLEYGRSAAAVWMR